MELRPGDNFAGYTVERRVGGGGIGTVYLARHPRLMGRTVALKVLNGGYANDPDIRMRFTREAVLTARLEHPNIVHVYDCSNRDEEILWISMRYVRGGDVAGLIAAEGGRLGPERAVRLTAGAADGLEHAHSNRVLHRDIKPSNLLLDGERVVVTDFGIARAVDDTRTARGVHATVAYAAPERFGDGEVDHRADIYSLGCTVFTMLTGRTPFSRRDTAGMIAAHLGEPPPRVTALRPELPEAVDEVIATAMAKDPASRYASCTELAAALGKAIAVRNVSPSAELALRFTARSDRGLEQQSNDDSVYAGQRLLAVADGFGHAPQGSLASYSIMKALAPLDSDEVADPLRALRAAALEGDRAIAERIAEEPARAGMGTTLTAILFDRTEIALVHLGDSRAYLLRGDHLAQLTDDGWNSGPGFSGRSDAAPAGTVHPVQPGDRYLLCTDGLHRVVPHAAILEVLRSPDSIDRCADRLIEKALRAGGPGNVTVVLADVV
ncbi:protein kinase [Nocardia sp. NPDC050697]|uniref:protein kinase domain-containing protein n=1 Tax=Nocardia sp. NPDC050697 TaxID=3155158 RepID=UPI00341043F6